MKMLLGAAAASRAAPQSIVVVPSPINESQWDGPSSTPSVTFGPRYLSASSVIGNSVYSVIRHATSKDSGKFYMEFLLNNIAGGFLPAMGVISEASYPFRAGVPLDELGGPLMGWMLRASGDLYFNGSLTSGYTPAFLVNDVMQVIVDLTAGTLWFGRNNTIPGNPAAGTGAAFSNLISIGGSAQAGGGALATIAGTIGYAGGGSDYGALTARFKAAEWQYAPPSGFWEWTP